MGWSPMNAANAYLDTIKLCKEDNDKKQDQCNWNEPDSDEFLSALAAGLNSKLILEIPREASNSTIALAAAARQTGGRLICILYDSSKLEESKHLISNSGLDDIVEFKVGDPRKLLPNLENIDFSLVDCCTDSSRDLLRLLDMNPRRAVVVANNLRGREGLCGDIGDLNLRDKGFVRSMKHPIGKGMEITMIGDAYHFRKVDRRAGRPAIRRKKSPKSVWVMEIDEESGEEHVFRVFR